MKYLILIPLQVTASLGFMACAGVLIGCQMLEMAIDDYRRDRRGGRVFGE